MEANESQWTMPTPQLASYDENRPSLDRSFSLSSLSTLDRDHEQLWQNLTDFYSSNEDTIEKAALLGSNSGAAEDKDTSVQAAMDTFVETANVILDGLVALGNVHPILGVAIFAFHGVIKLDLTRRDNNRKVIAVKLQMQNTMCAMFQLRTLRHVHVQDDKREKDRERLQKLVKVIAEEITKCGSDLNYYVHRKLVSKLVNAKGYERRFAEHVETFVQRRSELQMTIASYIAAGIDAVNISIAEVGSKLTIADAKLDEIVSTLRKLDTARERDCLAFIGANGGPQACVATDDLLARLLSISADDSETKELKPLQEVLEDARISLTRELSEDLQKALANNQSRFEKLLNVQNNNLKRISNQLEEQGNNMQEHNMKLDKLMNTSIMILEEGKLTRKAITPNAPVKLKDPELQKIWDRMGLKRSVKAKQFVLTFRDYLITDRSSVPNTPNPHSTMKLQPETGGLFLFDSSTSQVEHNPPSERLKVAEDAESELWVLKHIDVAHVQPIVEAMDEDGSGFISVREANKFALARPQGWSLLDWIAYWAAGWHINITDYRRKIYTTLQKMYKIVPTLLPVNKKFGYAYLSGSYIDTIEAVLRPIRSLPSNYPRDSRLEEIATSMANLQEQRLQANLQEMSYLIQTSEDVTLIAGTERVETWILPLLHLTLERHLEVFKVAQTKTLHQQELTEHSTSLSRILSLFFIRIVRLKEIFRQVYRDPSAQFENFAYGMFNETYDFKLKPSRNSILSFTDTIPDNEGTPVLMKEADTILTKGLGPSLEYADPDLNGADPPVGYIAHAMEGFWVATLRENQPEDPKNQYQPTIYLNIESVIDKQVSAKGHEYLGTVAITGNVEDSGSIEEPSAIDFKVVFTAHYFDIRMKGNHICTKDTIEGSWMADVPIDETKYTVRNGTFQMTRTPVHAFRFRSLLDRGNPAEAETSLTQARRRWAFATQATITRIREKSFSWNLMRVRIAERKRWIELSICEALPNYLRATRGFFSPQTAAEWERMKAQLHPTTAAFYEAIATYLYLRDWESVGFVLCDACRQRITFRRYVCITCFEEDLEDTLDFCAETQCTSLTVFETRDFVHDVSHTLLRTNRHFTNAEKQKLITQTAVRSERIKRSFREREARVASVKISGLQLAGRKRPQKADETTDNKLEGRPTLTPLVCVICKKDLSLPCWACAICAVDTLFCTDCERDQPWVQTSATQKHTPEHPLLRLHNSVEAKLIRPKSSNQQLEDVKASIDERLYALEDKMNEQLQDVKAAVDNVAKEMGQDKIVKASSNEEPPNDETNQKSPDSPRGTDSSNGKIAANIPEGLDEGILPAPEIPEQDRIAALHTKLENGLKRLEDKLESRLNIEHKLENRMDNLESKVEDILSIMKIIAKRLEDAEST